MTEALDAAKEYGYDVAKINANTKGSEVLWDSVNDVFCYLQEDGSIEYIPDSVDKGLEKGDYRLWKISNKVDTVYSTYLYNCTDTEVSTTKGIDVGECSISTVNYTNTGSAQNVVIRTKGDACTLTVNAPEDDVDFYGFAKAINVTAVASSSLHIYGACNNLSVATGHVEIEDTGIIFNISSNSGSITNNGFIAKAASGITITGTQIGSNYKIGTLAQLEAFRDAVNSGNNFAGLVVELTADIKLNDGWTPIGEGARKQGPNTQKTGEWAHTGTAFAGEFDGNNYTISNLNNNGFVPSTSRIGLDGSENMYCYGLFAMTESYIDENGELKGAFIHDLKLSDVNIDASIADNTKGDSVAALVGFSAGKLTVDNVDVIGNSSIKGVDGVGSIVGRAYKQDATTGNGGELTVTNCSSNATVSGTNASGSKIAGIVGYVILRFEGNSSEPASKAGTLTITGNTFTGNIITESSTYSDSIALRDPTYVKPCENCQGKAYK